MCFVAAVSLTAVRLHGKCLCVASFRNLHVCLYVFDLRVCLSNLVRNVCLFWFNFTIVLRSKDSVISFINRVTNASASYRIGAFFKYDNFLFSEAAEIYLYRTMIITIMFYARFCLSSQFDGS